MRIRLAATSLLSFATLAALTTLAEQAAPPPAPPAGVAAAGPATRPATAPGEAAATRPAVAPPLPPALPPRGAELADEQGKPVQGVKLAKANVLTRVQGPLAQVTVTLTFDNSQSRVLGGELVFPLPQGATVTGYGLDVNGVMVDGVAVEKQQARDIYEKEMHRRVDPGFVEQAAANFFRTRLYPVPANGSRSIKVQYVTEVARARGGGAAVSVPMGWGRLKRCAVRVEVPDTGAKPSFADQAIGLSFHGGGRGFAAEGELREVPEQLVVNLPDPPGPPERWVSVEKMARGTAPLEGAAGGQGDGAGGAAGRFEDFEHYFLLADPPPAPAARPAARAAAKPVRRLAVLWDAGLSRADSDTARQLRLLDSLLKRYDGATGELVVFRDTIEPPVSFDLGTPGGRDGVIERLRALACDGATDLSRLPLPKNVSGFGAAAGVRPPGGPAGNYDFLLLFTDGRCDLGGDGMREAQAPVYAFCDDWLANHALLQRVCRESGGAYLNLKRVSDGQALAAVGTEPWSLLSVESDPGQVADVYPAAPVPVEGSGRLTLVGRLLAPEATVTLNYGYGKKVVTRREVTLRAADATAGDLVPRHWAQQKAAELSIRPQANDAELSALARKFNLVTANTSLLVLETAEQYVRYRVAPPMNQPELYAAYLAGVQQNRVQEQTTAEQRLRQVLAEWDARVRWWEGPGAPDTAAGPGNAAGPPGQPLAEGREDPRSAERQARERKVQDVRQSRALARDALRALREGDAGTARDLYARAVGLDATNAMAANGLGEAAAALAGQTTPRARLAEQARERSAHAALAFRDALTRSADDVRRGNPNGAGDEINRAQEALEGGAWSRSERSAFNARLAEATRQAGAARRAAARNAPAERAKQREEARKEQEWNEQHPRDRDGPLFGPAGAGGPYDDGEGPLARPVTGPLRGVAPGGFGGGTLSGGGGPGDDDGEGPLARAPAGLSGSGAGGGGFGGGTLFGGGGGTLFGGSGGGGPEAARPPVPARVPDFTDSPKTDLSGSGGGRPGSGSAAPAGGAPPPAPPPPPPVAPPPAAPPPAAAAAGIADTGGPGSSVGSDPPAAPVAPGQPGPAGPYLPAIEAAPPGRAYDTFLELRKTHGRSPAFYLDCADALRGAGEHALAVRVTTDVAALGITDARLLRLTAERLRQLGEQDRAVELLERVLRLRPDEPQSLRDLALALSDRADEMADLPRGDARRDPDRIAADYGRCLDLLNQVVTREWGPWPGVELPCLMEANRVIARARRLEGTGAIPTVPVPLDPRLIRNLDCDLRVVMTWDFDETRLDLSVTEPDGETVSSFRPYPRTGGMVDGVTTGYGPQEYCLRHTRPGGYVLRGGSLNSPHPVVTVRATVFADFGRPGERRKTVTLRLPAQQGAVFGTFTPGSRSLLQRPPAAPAPAQ